MIPAAAVSTLVVNVVLPTLATVAVGLRLIARRAKSQSLSLDDYLIILALVCAVAVCMEGIYASTTGLFGVPFENMTLQTYQRFRKVLFIDEIIVDFALGIIKISVVLFYKRIFVTPKFQRTANIVNAIVSMWIITAFFGVLFSSHPVSAFWTTPPQLDLTEYTINLTDFNNAMAAIDLTLDLVILTLPIPVIKNLHMDRRRKLSLICVFMLGAFCVIASAVRLYYIHALLSFSGSDSARRTFLSDSNDLWGHIESCASIFAACLPTLGPLFVGRSAESLVGSIRSAFSIKSGLSLFSVYKQRRQLSEEGKSDSSSTQGGKAWTKLDTMEPDSHVVGHV